MRGQGSRHDMCLGQGLTAEQGSHCKEGHAPCVEMTTEGVLAEGLPGAANPHPPRSGPCGHSPSIAKSTSPPLGQRGPLEGPAFFQEKNQKEWVVRTRGLGGYFENDLLYLASAWCGWENAS